MNELLNNKYRIEDQSEEIQNNLKELLEKMNKIRTLWAKPMTVTSGLRSSTDQQRINPSAPKSKHLLGLACDISDTDGSLMIWILNNLLLMQNVGLYFEDFRYTPNWIHFQAVPPTSGKRIFIPSSNTAPSPNRWDGKYDDKYNHL
jgi:hypothetical protein